MRRAASSGENNALSAEKRAPAKQEERGAAEGAPEVAGVRDVALGELAAEAEGQGELAVEERRGIAADEESPVEDGL